MLKVIKYKYLNIIFCLSLLFVTKTGVGQNFKGGIDDGYAASTIVNSNFNLIPEYFTVTITLADGQQTPTNSSTVHFKAAFNKNTIDFVSSDVIFGGTANPTTVLVTGSGMVYDIAVSGMTNDGTVNVTIAAGVCEDQVLHVLNPTSINSQNEVVCDITKPTATIEQAVSQTDPTNISPINFTVTFSEAVTGFDVGDISLGGTATGPITALITGTGPSYNVAVSGMSGDGTVTATVIAGGCTDLTGNTNTISTSTDNSVLFQISAFTVTLNQAIGQADPTNLLPIIYSVDFSRNVSDFTFDDIVWTGTANGISGNVSGSGTTYSVNITNIALDGSVIATIPSDKVHDNLAIGNQASTSIDNTIIFDNTRPAIEILMDLGQNNPTNNPIISFNANFTEQVLGFDPSDVSISGTAGANIVNLSGGPLIYKIDVSGMTNAGTVIISIAENLITDNVGNLNFQSVNTNNSIDYDNVKPDVALSSISSNQTSEIQIPFGILFSKPIEGFDISDINLSNGTIIALSEMETGIRWEGTITPISEGLIYIEIPADAANDIAGNFSNASNQLQIDYIVDENIEFEASNIFTPNSSLNRYWTIKNVAQYSEYKLTIKNSVGQLVYETINYQNDWNGTYKNKPLPTGTYYYFLSLNSKNIIHKGFVNIIYE